MESPPPLCPRNLHWWCFRKQLCIDGKACDLVEHRNCFKLLWHIEGDPFWSLGFYYTTALVFMSFKDVTKHLFVVQTNSHIFTMMSQQTCSPQISSLGVFTVVDKLFQPARSGVMKFVTWCLQQFSEAACVCFLCHCISTLKEKEIHKIRNEYLI